MTRPRASNETAPKRRYKVDENFCSLLKANGITVDDNYMLSFPEVDPVSIKGMYQVDVLLKAKEMQKLSAEALSEKRLIEQLLTEIVA